MMLRLAATAALAAAGTRADELQMRPAHTTKLTPENFDEWVAKAVDNKKTAMVRWMASDDSSKSCEWLGKGFLFDEPDESEIEYVEGSTEPDHSMPDGPDHYDQLQKEMRTEPCAVCRAMAKAWNDVTLEYKDDPDVFFGDIVLADPAVKAVSDKLKSGYTPTGLGYGGVKDYEGEGPETMDDNMLEDEDTFDESEDTPTQYASRFDKEVARMAHHPDLGGCAISYYNQAEEGNDQPVSPHCLDLLEPHTPYEAWDEDGNIVPPTAEELEKRDAMVGKLAMHQLVVDTKEHLEFRLEQLEHLDTL